MESADHWRFCQNEGYPLASVQPRAGATWEKRCNYCLTTYYCQQGHVVRENPDGTSGKMVNVRVHLHDGSLACDYEPESEE